MQISNNNTAFTGNIYKFPLDYKTSLAYQDSTEPAEDIAEQENDELKLLDSLDALACGAVFIRNGMAVTSKGLPYTGSMMTPFADGSYVNMKFKNGQIQSSDINGEYKKIYIPFRRSSKDKALEVRMFDSSKHFMKDCIHYYDENNKVKRCIQSTPGQMQALDFQDGKISAKTFYASGVIKSAVIKDENGQTVRIIEKYPQYAANDYVISDFNPDGSLLNRIGKINQSFKTPAQDIDIKGAPRYISYDGDDCRWELNNESTEDAMKVFYERTENDETTTVRAYSPFNDGHGGYIEFTKPDGRKIRIEEDGRGGLSYAGHMPRQDFRFMRKEILNLLNLCEEHGIQVQ